jgi:predicted DNA-binding transcriptional regulator YafY
MQREIAVIASAITKRRTVQLYYDPGLRIIEPHALGYGSSGQVLLRAFQTEGASASGEHVNWKLFRVDRITGLESTDVCFDGPRPEYKRDDRAMKRGIISQL